MNVVPIMWQAVIAQGLGIGFTGREVFLDVGYFLGGTVLITMVFYFVLYKFMIDRHFLPYRAYHVSTSLTLLYAVTWATILFYKYHLLPEWQWSLVFLFAAGVWLLHFAMAMSAKE